MFEAEPGGEPPINHVFFLPNDDNLGPTPFPVAGQSDPSDVPQAEGKEEGVKDGVCIIRCSAEG